MSEETSSPTQKRAVAADISAATASTINSQGKADKMVRDGGHESSHMTPIDSQKITVRDSALQSHSAQSRKSSKSSKTVVSHHGQDKINFSINSILSENSDDNETSAVRDSNLTPNLPPDSKLESLIDTNTGQMTHSGVKFSVISQPKPTSNSTLRVIEASKDKAIAENAKFSQAVPPGFAAAAAAAAVAAADAGAHPVSQFPANAAGEIAAATDAGVRPDTPWAVTTGFNAAAANAGATIALDAAVANADARASTPWSTYATQPYIQPIMRGNSTMAQMHVPSMTLHYVPRQGILLPLVQGHSAVSHTMTHVPPHQTMVAPQLQPPPAPAQMMMPQMQPPQPLVQPPPPKQPPPPPMQAPRPHSHPPPPPLKRQGEKQAIRCVPSDRLTMPRTIPRIINMEMPRGQMGHSLPMAPSQDIRQFPQLKATITGGLSEGQNETRVNHVPVLPMNIASPVPPMPPHPPLMQVYNQNPASIYGVHSGGQHRPAWPVFSPLIPKETHGGASDVFKEPSCLPMHLRGRPRTIAPHPQLPPPFPRAPPPPMPPPLPPPPPPQPIPQLSPAQDRQKGKQQARASQQRPTPPPTPPVNQMDDRPRGRPRTKARPQQPRSAPPQRRPQPPPQARPQSPATTPTLPPSISGPVTGNQPQEASSVARRQQRDNVGEMTSQMASASMKSISRAMKQFGPKKKSNRKKASNYDDNIEPEQLIAQPDVEHISAGASHYEDDDSNMTHDSHVQDNDDVINDHQGAPSDFKVGRLSSLQLNTAKAMLEKERKELQRKKMIDMLMDERTTITPYNDHYEEQYSIASLFLASYIINTPGCHEVFICKSCNKEVAWRQSFRSHNRTKSHLKYLKEWIKMIKSNNFEDDVNGKKRRISEEDIKKTEEAIETHTEFLNMARARFYVQCKDQLIAQDVHEEEVPIEVVDLTQQINDLEYCAFNRAVQSVKDLCPGQFDDFKKQVINLISTMYFDRPRCELQIQFNVGFYDAKKPKRHWIPKFFENIKRRSNPRQFMLQQFEIQDFSFAQKNVEQMKEIRAICGMARLLYPIFLQCDFVPNSYVILLAVLMDTNFRVETQATSIRLKNGYIIDLLLRSGIAVLDPTTDVRSVRPPEPEISKVQQEFLSIQAESAHQAQLPNTVWSNEGVDVPNTQFTHERIFTTDESPQTFLSNAGMNIESDLLLNQTRIQEDIKLNNIEANSETIKIDDHDWSLDQGSYQKTYSSCSSSTSIQSTQGDDTNEHIIEEHDYYNADEEAMDHETEVSHILEDKSATICVPNLPNEVAERELRDLFQSYGPILDIQIETSKNGKFRNGCITFRYRSNAISSMISMNNTAYKHKKFNIVMSERKKRHLRKCQSRLEESPLENLTTLVQNMTSASSNQEVDPEAEIAIHYPEEEISEESPQLNPTDSSTKKSHKRKLNSNLQEDTTKSSKPDIEGSTSEERPEIIVEVDVNANNNPVEDVVEIHTEFEIQCRMASLPPDPINLANCLFAYWEQHLNFYEDVDRSNNGQFAVETINHLATLMDDATSHHIAQQEYEEENNMNDPE